MLMSFCHSLKQSQDKMWFFCDGNFPNLIGIEEQMLACSCGATNSC